MSVRRRVYVIRVEVDEGVAGMTGGDVLELVAAAAPATGCFIWGRYEHHDYEDDQ